MNDKIISCEIPKIGKILAANGPKGICRLEIVCGEKIDRNIGKKIKYSDLLKSPLDLFSGTIFQQKIWRAIMKIPKGETRSYAWLAKTAGHPRAIRAAANACGANPIPILIPCHRVIKSDKTIGGFSGPMRLKKLLLKVEGISF